MLEAVLEQSPLLRGRPVTVSLLGGGLTNTSYRVRTKDGGDFVCRVAGEAATVLEVDREREAFNAKAAADAGVGPSVLESDPATGWLVTAFIPGRPLQQHDATHEAVLPGVARMLRKLHAGSPFQGEFDLTAIRSRYEEIAKVRGSALPDAYTNARHEVADLEARLAGTLEPRIPCHNDLVPANVIAAADRVWLIDYEFSAMNEASFELGNLVNEWALDPAQTRLLVGSYWGKDSRNKLARAYVWAFLAAHTWLLWATIYQGTVGGDVLTERLRRFEEIRRTVDN